MPIFLKSVSKCFRREESESQMDSHTLRRHDAHVRVNGVCTENRAVLDPISGVQDARTTLGTCVSNVDAQLTERKQAINDRLASTEQIRRSRRALHDLAKGIVQVAPLVNEGTPLMETLQRPGRVRRDGELIPYMRGLAERVSPRADAFVAAGLPADHLQKLGDEIDRFVAGKDLQTNAVQRSAAAEEAIRTSQETARKTIAALEAVAMGIKAAHPEILTKLRVAMRVGPRIASGGAASPPGPPGSPAAPASPAPSPPPSTNDKAA